MTPWTTAHHALLFMEFSRQVDWRGLPFLSPGALPDPGIEPRSPALQADSLPSEPPGKALILLNNHSKMQEQWCWPGGHSLTVSSLYSKLWLRWWSRKMWSLRLLTGTVGWWGEGLEWFLQSACWAPDEDITQKENYRPTSVMNIDTDPQQNTSKQNPTTHLKAHTPQSSEIYPRDANWRIKTRWSTQ